MVPFWGSALGTLGWVRASPAMVLKILYVLFSPRPQAEGPRLSDHVGSGVLQSFCSEQLVPMER